MNIINLYINACESMVFRGGAKWVKVVQSGLRDFNIYNN
jgi:hypothetical protein